jgi:CTP synthase
MQAEGLDRVVAHRLGLPDVDADMSEWVAMVERATAPRDQVTVALVGKYVDLPDAYLSVVEALRHGGMEHGVTVDIRWVTSDDLTEDTVARVLLGCDAIVVPGGFGYRGFEGKIEAARHAREHAVPYLGLCLGLHAAVIEFARNVLGLTEANSAEFEPTTPDPVINLMPDQREVTDKGGTMRLGSYPAKLLEGSLTRAVYGDEPVVYERHRHRFEVLNKYRESLTAAGLVISGVSPDDRLVEFIELTDHPWFVATQAHPEFKSRPNRAHPLFAGVVGAAIQRRRETHGRLPVVLDEPTAAEVADAVRIDVDLTS